MGDARPALPSVPVLVGPTASGKTAVVTALAALTPVAVVSADSRQIYRGLDIGTAKPAPTERAAAPYYGLDVVTPAERYSAGRFARDASDWIARIRADGRLPIVVGGTGFYLRALFDGLFTEPPLDPTRRERLREALQRLDGATLGRWAARLDAGFRGGGRQRAARAIEVALLAGRSLSVLQRDAAGPRPELRPWYVRLAVPRAELAQRIAVRTATMLEAGLVDEVRRALAAGLDPAAPGLSGVGYPEVIAHLAGRIPAADLPVAIAAATRRYAKRQETWFRHQLRGPVTVLDAALAPDTLARALLGGYRATLAATD